MDIDFSKHGISSKIETGEYFCEARKWHFEKYVFIRSQHLYFCLLALILLFSSYVAINTARINYDPKSFPIPLYFNYDTNSFLRISTLSQEGDNINNSIARYLISYYVKSRESYNPIKITPLNWNEYTSKLLSVSSRKVFNQFQNYMNPSSNPDSPILLYKDNTARDITIKNIIFNSSNGVPDKATIWFEAIERNRDGYITTSWKAEVQFNMPDMSLVFEDPELMEFMVTDYVVQPILQ